MRNIFLLAVFLLGTGCTNAAPIVGGISSTLCPALESVHVGAVDAGLVCEGMGALVDALLAGRVIKLKALASGPRFKSITFRGRPLGAVRAELAADLQRDLDRLPSDVGSW